ncbi:unnamed protein product, partial [Dicrocoelium dendriticum]
MGCGPDLCSDSPIIKIVQTLTIRCETLAVTSADQKELTAVLGGKISELELQNNVLRSPNPRPVTRQKLSSNNAIQCSERQTPLVKNSSENRPVERPLKSQVMLQSMQSYAQIARSPPSVVGQQLTPTDSATNGVARKKACCSLGLSFTEDKPETPTQEICAHKELKNKQLVRNQMAIT